MGVLACTRGEAVPCVGLARLYERGLGVDKNPEKARELYGKGCDGGVPIGCNRLPSEPSATPPSQSTTDSSTVQGVGAATCTGKLSPANGNEIAQLFVDHVRACYERELYEQPTATGTVHVHFEVAEDGTVSLISMARAGALSFAFEQCAADAFAKRPKISPPSGGCVKVVAPLRLVPMDGGVGPTPSSPNAEPR